MHGHGVLRQRVENAIARRRGLLAQAVRLHQHREARRLRERHRQRRAGGRQGRAVQVLDGRRHRAGRVDATDGLDPLPQVALHGEDRMAGLGRRDQPQPDRGDDAERALGADEQPHEVVARHVLAGVAAELHDLAGRHHDLQPLHPRPRDAVLEAVRPAGVRGDVAADVRLLQRARVRRVVEAVLARRVPHPTGGDAGLGDHPPPLRVDRADGLQALQREHHAALRHRARRVAGAAAAGDDRDVVLVAPGQHVGDLLRRARAHERVGAPADAAGHARVHEVLRRHRGRRVLGADDAAELAGERVRGLGNAHGFPRVWSTAQRASRS